MWRTPSVKLNSCITTKVVASGYVTAGSRVAALTSKASSTSSPSVEPSPPTPIVHHRPRTTLTTIQQEAEADRGKRARTELLTALPSCLRSAVTQLAPEDNDDDDLNWEDIPIGEGRPSNIGDNMSDTGGDNNCQDTYQSYINMAWGTGGQVDRAERALWREKAWNAQLPDIVDAFLNWRQEASMTEPPAPLAPPYTTCNVVDMWSTHACNRHFPVASLATTPNVTLIRSGLLSNVPVLPKYAVSLITLETYRVLRNRKPSLSVQVFVRTMCDLHLQRFWPIYSRQFSEVYDAYMHVLRGVNKCVAQVLGCDVLDWRLANTCPPCMYKLEDKPHLPYDLLLTIDGGNSLKRFTTSGLPAATPFQSLYFLLRTEVNEMANEVVHRVRPKKGKGKQREVAEDIDADVEMELAENGGQDNDDGQAVEDEDMAGDTVYKAGNLDAAASGIADLVSVCVERWKVNADDTKKGMFSCFDESGIFILVCRHGSVIVVADMVRSGELAKYPLAILKKIQEVHPGAKLEGYNIECAFEKTAAHSSLGSTLNIRFVIPSMHGYTHNCPCQIGYHPHYTPGTGLEDFEGCERGFSASNECARLTHHSTAFHCHQAIDTHYKQWDSDKYKALGYFIFNNYCQAIFIIANTGALLDDVKSAHKIVSTDFPKWLEEEKEYLAGLTTEPEGDTLAMGYVLALEELRAAKAVKATESSALWSVSSTKHTIRPTMKAAQAKVMVLIGRVSEFESLLDITTQWTPASSEYKETLQYIVERKYRLALDHLERLVVQCLFELQKIHRATTGYKLRTAIAKHLKSCSEAIRTAIWKYNTAASTLSRPTLSIATVLAYSFIGEFDILCDACTDVRKRIWASPGMRTLLDNFYKPEHAEEEILCLNVEIRRLCTWIRDNTGLWNRAFARLSPEEPDIAHKLRRRMLVKVHVNARIEGKLDETEYSATVTTVPASSVVGDAYTTARPTDLFDADNISESLVNDEARNGLDGLEAALERMAAS